MKSKLKSVSSWILTVATHGKSILNPKEQCPQNDMDILIGHLYPFTELVRGGFGDATNFIVP